jgi:hypothetical protein
MKRILAMMLFVLGMAIGVLAQSDPLPITVGTVADAGPAFYGHPNLYSVPVTVGGATGTMWLYPQACNSSGICGWVFFRSPLEGPNGGFATVTDYYATAFDSQGRPTSLFIAFKITNAAPWLPSDPDGDGDVDQVTGSFTINFNYFYTGAGRGRGWHEGITGGSGSQYISQD